MRIFFHFVEPKSPSVMWMRGKLPPGRFHPSAMTSSRIFVQGNSWSGPNCRMPGVSYDPATTSQIESNGNVVSK